MRTKFLEDLNAAKQDGLTNQELFFNATMFTILSIRTQFSRIGSFWQAAKEGQSSPFWGHKKEAKKQLLETGSSIADYIEDTYWQKKGAVKCIYKITELHGLGPTKASFILQLMGYPEACLDSNNLKEIGLKPKHTKFPKKATPETQLKNIERYRSLWHNYQPADAWWDQWCIQIAERYKQTPEEISQKHNLVLERGIQWG